MTNSQSKLIALSAVALIGLSAQSSSLYAADTYQSEEPPEMETSVAKSIAIDASSEDSFRLSLKAMRAVLDAKDRTKLSLALKKLAGDYSVMTRDESETSDMSSTSRITALYETLGSRLNGKTYDDIIAMAG